LSAGAFLACDWGTTNLRAWVVGAGGSVQGYRAFPQLGVSRLAAGQAAECFRDEIRPAMEAEGLPALMCGMIGSTLGWVTAPYLTCPASLEDLRQGLISVEDGPPTRIVPGLRGPGVTGASDVMRGEETQILGWVSLEPERARGRQLVCHPGTHAKWALVEDGRIVRFVTAMTGELFDVLRKHSVLKTTDAPEHLEPFLEGVRAAGDGDGLASRLFSVRARVVADGKDADTTSEYLSGLLIGAEVASAPRLLGVELDGPVQLIGDIGLCRWYEKALATRGITAHLCDGDMAVLAGLKALQQGASA
jgi:2-dehydro-3-deoxygalactonokinase